MLFEEYLFHIYGRFYPYPGDYMDMKIAKYEYLIRQFEILKEKISRIPVPEFPDAEQTIVEMIAKFERLRQTVLLQQSVQKECDREWQ